ncbi:cytochrome P450 [Hyaloscypha variabilis F]|uniref:Cytochrome P450 n=1 Tax=Hyaloscypha variabilis (strain UAMH 11265 / GT02V1 / F) TaxID=1149755 RepID=A0A2J6R3Q9_HYAVF|nr:cytochrome P450 [Hyaloscypha variabilis F]
MEFQTSYLSVLGILVSITLLYSLAKGIYRIAFHPLHSFPGPTMASITNWHRFYYNWYLGGLHSQKIKEWHTRCGPIIRIAPNELHFSSASAYRAIYTHPDLQKEPEFYKFMTEDSLVGQTNAEYHRGNRRLFAGYFSANAIRAQGDVNGVLWRKASHFCDTLRVLCRQSGGQTTMNIIHIARCFSYDVIKEFVLEASDTSSTGAPAHNPPFVAANANITKSIRFVQQFPSLVPIVRALPDTILQLISLDLLAMKQERLNCQAALHPSLNTTQTHSPAIGAQILASEKHRITTPHLAAELFDFHMAGTELPAQALAFAIHELALHPPLISRLREELQSSFPYPTAKLPTLAQIEKLEYLSAVVKEVLRLGNLIPGRLPRVTPLQGIEIDGVHVPGGVSVSASSWMVHMDEEVFAAPEAFVPERWLGEKASDECWVPFSVGRRDCIGRWLAVAELKMVVVGLVAGFEVEGSGEELGEWRDCIVRRWEGDVRVVVRERRLGGEGSRGIENSEL